MANLVSSTISFQTPSRVYPFISNICCYAQDNISCEKKISTLVEKKDMKVEQHKVEQHKVCLHWMIEKFGDVPFLEFGNTIYKMCKDKISDQELLSHLSEAKDEGVENIRYSVDMSWCGNPWNLFSDREEALALSHKPVRDVFPVHGKRVKVELKKVSLEEIRKGLSYAIGGDCWSIFTLDGNDIPVKIYYFLKDVYETSEVQIFRNQLIQDPSCLVKDIENEYQVVLSMGGEPFIDKYFFKLDDNYFTNFIYYK